MIGQFQKVAELRGNHMQILKSLKSGKHKPVKCKKFGSKYHTVLLNILKKKEVQG